MLQLTRSSLVRLAVAAILWLTAGRPSAAQVRTDEELLFFPTAGRLSPDGATWQVPIHAWVYEPERNSIVRRALLSRLATELQLEDDADARETLAARSRWLLVDNERGKRIEIALGDRRHTLPPTAEDGHTEDVLTLPAEEAAALQRDGRVTFRAILPDGDEREFTGTATLVPATGLTIISDLDDTVRVSEVTDRRRLLRRTFIEPFEAVDGMADRYRRWTESGAAIHIVSASPWQLYAPLSRFLDEAGFPEAVWHMKRLRLKDPSVLKLFDDPEEYKLHEISGVLEAYPGRRFVLIGDSGEQDPEIYGEAARRFPDQIVRIAIRDVTDEPADADRYDAAFRGVPGDHWQVFENAEEIVSPLEN